MSLSLQSHLLMQYGCRFNLNQLPLLLMDKRSTQSRNSWILTGWESISSTRSHMRDMGRNTMNGYSGTICWRTLEQNLSRTMRRSFMPNTQLQNTILTRLGLEPRGEGLSRKDKKTCSET